MRHFTSLAAGIALVGSLVGGVAAHADEEPVSEPAAVEMTSRYWACVAIDHVHIGACVENPLPDPSEWGSLRGIVREHTGVDVP